MTTRVRDVSGDDDLDAWVEIRNLAYPWLRLGRDDVRRERETEPRHRLLLGVDGEEIAGCARATSDDESPDECQAGVFVHQDFRRHGVGTALASVVVETARAWRATHLEGITVEGEPGELFARSLGLVPESRLLAVRLALGDPPPAASLPGGVDRIVPLAAEPGLAPGAWEVARSGLADLPAGAASDGPAYAAWCKETFEDGFIRPDLSAVAVEGDQVVGWAALGVRTGDPEVGIHELTAVRRDRRGNGVATALKREQIGWACAAGLTTLHASNDEENAPMRSINRLLGYEPAPTRLWMHGPLPAGLP